MCFIIIVFVLRFICFEYEIKTTFGTLSKNYTILLTKLLNFRCFDVIITKLSLVLSLKSTYEIVKFTNIIFR